MFETAAPIDLLRTHVRLLIHALPPVYDGQIEAVHDARVSTRRIRELLPLTDEWYGREVIDDLSAMFRQIGKGLGRVRDADVRIALLAYLETRIPPAAPSLVVLSQQRAAERLRLMRKLIKRFERVDAARVLGGLVSGRTAARRWAKIAGHWREQMRRSVTDRARATREAVHHATGVYFPNRLHATRIALKKFRYALEIAGATGVGPAAGDLLRHLKKTQDVLGDLHDRQVLIDDLPKSARPERVEIDPDHIKLVDQFAEAECRDLHARYLERRARVLEACDRFDQRSGQRGASVAVVAAALAIPSALYLWRRASAAESPRRLERPVSVRITIPDTTAPAR